MSGPAENVTTLPVKLETSVIKYLLGEHSGDLYC